MKLHILILTIIVATLSSCRGTQVKARQDALMPAAKLAWGNEVYGVRSDTERGIADAVEDGDLIAPESMLVFVTQMEAALTAEDRGQLGEVPWASLKPYAERGIQDRIDDGEMVPQAAAFLTKRLMRFDNAFSVLTDPSYLAGHVELPPARVRPSRLQQQPVRVAVVN